MTIVQPSAVHLRKLWGRDLHPGEGGAHEPWPEEVKDAKTLVAPGNNGEVTKRVIGSKAHYQHLGQNIGSIDPDKQWADHYIARSAHGGQSKFTEHSQAVAWLKERNRLMHRVEPGILDLRDGYSLKPGSTMVSLDVPPGTLPKTPDGVDDHHITIVYAGQTDDDTFEQILQAVADLAAQTPPLTGTISGLGHFEPSAASDGKVPVFAVPHIPGIEALRPPLQKFNASEHTDFKPHVTLSYVQPGDKLPDPVPPTPVTFTHIAVHKDKEGIVQRFPFTGTRAATQKFTKPQVDYRATTSTVVHCTGCSNVEEHGDADSTCRIVEGTVDRHHVCDRFTMGGPVVRVEPGVLHTRDWTKWNLEHPYLKKGRGRHTPISGAPKAPRGPKVEASVAHAGEIPPIPKISKAEMGEKGALVERFRKEAQDVSKNQYKVGSSRGQHFEEGYIAARLHAQREQIDSEQARAIQKQHLEVASGLQANQARAKREGAAAGYLAHAAEHAGEKPPEPETHTGTPEGPAGPNSGKYLPGSPKFAAFNEGHNSSLKIAANANISAVEARRQAGIQRMVIDSSGPGVDRARAEGSESGFLAHAEAVERGWKPPGHDTAPPPKPPTPEPDAHTVTKPVKDLQPGDQLMWGAMHVQVAQRWRPGDTSLYLTNDDGTDHAARVDRRGGTNVVVLQKGHPRYVEPPSASDSSIGGAPLPGGKRSIDVKTGLTYAYHEQNQGFSDHSIIVQAIGKDGKVVGHLNAHPNYGYKNVNGPVVSIWKYATAEDQRRKGIARQMVETIHENNPDAKILHSGFVSAEGEKFAESMNPRYNMVMTDKDRGFRKPKGLIEATPGPPIAETSHHLAGTPNPGQHVVHPELGGGTVESVGAKEAVVDFGSNGRRSFGVHFAPGETHFEKGTAPEHVPTPDNKPIEFVTDHSLSGKPTTGGGPTVTKTGWDVKVGDRLVNEKTPIAKIERTEGRRGFYKLTMEDGTTKTIGRSKSITVEPKVTNTGGEMLPALPGEKLVEDLQAGDVVKRTMGNPDEQTHDVIKTVKSVKGEGRGRYRNFTVTYDDNSTSNHYKGHQLTVMPPEGAMRPATAADKTTLEPGSREWSSFNSGYEQQLTKAEQQPYSTLSAQKELQEARVEAERATGGRMLESRRGMMNGRAKALEEILGGQHGGVEDRHVGDLKEGDVVGKNSFGNDIVVKSASTPVFRTTLQLASKDAEGNEAVTEHTPSADMSVALLPHEHNRERMFAIQRVKKAQEMAKQMERSNAMSKGSPSVPISEADRQEGRRQVAQMLLRDYRLHRQNHIDLGDIQDSMEYHRQGYASPGAAADDRLMAAKKYPDGWDVGSSDWLARMKKALVESSTPEEFREKAPKAEEAGTSGRGPGPSFLKARDRALSNAETALRDVLGHESRRDESRASNDVIDKLADAIATGGVSPAPGGSLTAEHIGALRRAAENQINADTDGVQQLRGLSPEDFARHAAVMRKGQEIADRIDARSDVRQALADERETRNLESTMPPSIPLKLEETAEETAARQQREQIRQDLRSARKETVAKAKQVLHDATMEELAKEREFGGGAAEHPLIGTSKGIEDQVRDQMKHFPTQWIKNSSLGRLLTVRDTKAGTRNHYIESGQTTQALEKKGATGKVAILTNAKGEKSVAVHELGHRMEDTNPGLGKLEAAHIETRSVGEGARWLGRGYGRNETAKVDRFVSPYAGKIYGNSDGFHEVLTMGTQALLGEDESTSSHGRLLGIDGNPEDPQLRQFVLGTMALHANPDAKVSEPKIESSSS